MAAMMMRDPPRLGVSWGAGAHVTRRTPQATSKAMRTTMAVLRLLRPMKATKAASACAVQSFMGTAVGGNAGGRLTSSWQRHQQYPLLHWLAYFLASRRHHHNKAAPVRTTLSRKANDAPQTSGAAGRMPLTAASS